MSPRIIAVVCMLVASLSVVSCTGMCTCDRANIEARSLVEEGFCSPSKVVVVVSVTDEPEAGHYAATVVRVEMGSSNVVTEDNNIIFQIESNPTCDVTPAPGIFYILSAKKNDFKDMLTEVDLTNSDRPMLQCSDLVQLPCNSVCEGSFDAPDLDVCNRMADWP